MLLVQLLHVVSTATVHLLTLPAQAILLAECVPARVEMRDAGGYQHSLGVVPRARADAVACIDCGLPPGCRRAEIGPPLAPAHPGAIGELLAEGAADPLEFLARVLVHIPDKGQVTTRYYRVARQSAARDAAPGGARPRRCARADRGVHHAVRGDQPDQLTHLRTRATSGDRRSARSPPSTAAPVARGASRARRRPTASTAPLHAP